MQATTTSPVIKRQLWAFVAMIAGTVATLVALGRGQLGWALGWAAVTLAAYAAARVWSREDPGPMPYLVRWILLVPRPYQSARQLRRVLAPRRGERILDVGPGLGVHALPIAAAVGPDGVLNALDIQHEMLGALMQRASQAGIANIVPTRADAAMLPFADHSFDGAYLISVLGEVPDRDAALQELRRVLKPSGRLVIGELCIDPDFIATTELLHRTGSAGFIFDGRVGPGLAYLARFKTAR